MKGEHRSSVSRFASAAIEVERSVGLSPNHPAVVKGTTLFPTTVVSTWDSPRFLVSGHNNPKLGKQVLKGPRTGWPIFHVTLEERATCPRSCAVWADCLAPGTRILTADLQWTPVEALKVGQRIAGFDEYPAPGVKQRKSTVAVVEELGRAVRPSVRIVTDRGEVTASTGHLWLAKKGRPGFQWHRSDELAPGDQVQFLAEPWEQDVTYDGGRVRGFLEGEGYAGAWSNGAHAKPRIGWGQLPGRLIDEINGLVVDRGFSISVSHRQSGARKNTIALTEVLGGWREVLRFLGVFRPTRLIERAEDLLSGHAFDGRATIPATVLAIEPLGDLEVVTIATSSKTLIAEGFLAHNCYGNAMPYARRHSPDADFIAAMKAEIVTLARANRKGLLIRLHALGDFYSLAYVEMWAQLIDFLPQLHVFGYTARSEEADDEESQAIARAIRELAETRWDRFSVRFSRAEPGPQRSIVVEADPELPDVIVCPAQTGGTDACATCGLCWAPAARDKTIAFLRHGMKRATGPRTAREPRQARPPRVPRPKPERVSYGRPGRKLIGGLPGETKEDRAKRIALYAIDHPSLSADAISEALRVPWGAVNAALSAGVPGRIAHTDRTRKPRQVFTPSPPPPATAEERIAALPAAELARIAKTYGAVVRTPEKELA
ncbi:MAG: hypothetical protein HY859_06845 [Caulobacterales bacterium]|nr:hypothetical protein [Caulobacterales bacterium]